MSESKPIKTALVSVFHKDGLDEILSQLAANGVKFISTGGTREFIEGLGHECAAVEDLTGYPPILGGRVKTLHPKVFGAILNKRSDSDHRQEVARFAIPDIDLVIVDLYPFEQTVASGASEADIIEKIDIGGISLIRAAAKNFADVAIVASKREYPLLATLLKRQGASTTLAQRKDLAARAFAVSSGYDTAIFNWFASQPEGEEAGQGSLRVAVDGSSALRYGENPHQQARFYGDLASLFTQLHGKELSYNNLLDIDSATGLVADIHADNTSKAVCAILKHNNPCGVAVADTGLEAWTRALEGDPQSAFGGIICLSCPVDAAMAAEIDKIFLEVILAPAYSDEALETLKHKKNRIILQLKEWPKAERRLRSCLDGMLSQQADALTAARQGVALEPMTKAVPTAAETADLLLAETIVKHCKSNAIVLVKDGRLCGSGTGQTSRVDAVRHAIEKARTFNLPTQGAVLASDAFFPFADSVELAHAAGVSAIIQPGGSVRDQESIDFCNTHGMAMVKTGTRHFRH